MTPKQIELLPCPGCGPKDKPQFQPGIVEVFSDRFINQDHPPKSKSYRVECANCGFKTDNFEEIGDAIELWNRRPADTSQTMLEEARQQWENIPENFHSEFVIGLWFGEFSSDKVKPSYCDINGDWWTFEQDSTSAMGYDLRIVRQVHPPLKIQFLPSPNRAASLPSSVPCERDRMIEEAKHVMKNASAFLIQLSITLKDGDYKALSLKHADILKAALSKLREEAARTADIARALEPLVSYKKRDDASFWGDAFYRTIKVSTEDLDLAERVYRAIKSAPSEAQVP